MPGAGQGPPFLLGEERSQPRSAPGLSRSAVAFSGTFGSAAVAILFESGSKNCDGCRCHSGTRNATASDASSSVDPYVKSESEAFRNPEMIDPRQAQSYSRARTAGYIIESGEMRAEADLKHAASQAVLHLDDMNDGPLQLAVQPVALACEAPTSWGG